MTRAALRRWVLTVMALLAALLALAGYAGYRAAVLDDPASGWATIHRTIKDFTAFWIAIPAAWLGYCFNRRNAFLTVLDGLWRGMVDAKGKCVRYSFDPTPERYAEAQAALSAVIDNMRSVYRNVKESRRDIGYFPFEPLHDMRRTLARYGAALERRPLPQERARLQQELRHELTAEWNGLRSRFLLEFGAPTPSAPITSRDYRDPRRRWEDADQASSSTSQ